MLIHIVLRSGGAKLQSVQTLHILAGQSDAAFISPVAADLRTDKYVLEPASDERCEIILLRHGDVITSPNIIGSLSCVWLASEVQVNSSATELHHLRPTGAKHGVADTPEDETEDEEALDDTVTEVPVTQPVTQPTKTQPSATPRLREQGSTLVQETPTFDRTLGASEYDVASEDMGQHMGSAPPPHGLNAVAETFSTARTGQSLQSIMHNSSTDEMFTNRRRSHGSPEVRVNDRSSRKRQSAAASPEHKPSADSRSSKRAKTTVADDEAESDTVQPSPLDDLNANPSRQTYSAKAKRRVLQPPVTTPSKSARSSQRSATAANASAYEGEPPRVAISNSAIKEGGSVVKFLRKHGGTLVNSVEDDCNVLWYVSVEPPLQPLVYCID